MDCPREDSIAGFVDGSLDQAARGEITRHLASCEACRALVSELARDLPAPDTADSPRPATMSYPAPRVHAPQPATFRDGEVIADRYEIRRFLAAGGMGEVYEAADRELHTRVALKTVRAGAGDDPRMLGRFKREIALARKVTHPNVCRIFDVGFHQSDGRRIAFLSMEFLEGETLAARLSRGPMRVGEAQPIVEQLVAGLAAAHAEGVVHRDFKSPNVMLVARSTGPRAVITDFGLARDDDARPTTSQHLGLVGTPAYMAPEQVEGASVGAAADQYALGVVMFEMVTGRWPFVAETAMLTALRRLQEPPPSPLAYAPDLDPRWESAILRCLARAPEDRFPSLPALADALTRTLISDLPPEVAAAAAASRVPPPLAPPPSTPARSSRAPFALGAALALTGIGVAAFIAHAPAPAQHVPMPAPHAAAPSATAPPTIPSAPSPAPPPVDPPAPKPRHRSERTHSAHLHTAPAKPPDPALDHFILRYPDSTPR